MTGLHNIVPWNCIHFQKTVNVVIHYITLSTWITWGWFCSAQDATQCNTFCSLNTYALWVLHCKWKVLVTELGMMFFPTVTWLRQPPTYNNHWTLEIPSAPFGRCNSKFAAIWPRINHRCHFCHYFKCLYDSVAMLTRGPSWCLLGLLISNGCQGGRCAVEIRWSCLEQTNSSGSKFVRKTLFFFTNRKLHISSLQGRQAVSVKGICSSKRWPTYPKMKPGPSVTTASAHHTRFSFVSTRGSAPRAQM